MARPLASDAAGGNVFHELFHHPRHDRLLHHTEGAAHAVCNHFRIGSHKDDGNAVVFRKLSTELRPG